MMIGAFLKPRFPRSLIPAVKRLNFSVLRDSESRVWTVPNALTLLRLSLSPVVSYQLFMGEYVVASSVFVAACFLDVADGWVARRFNQTSKLGSYLDPLADKVLIACTAIPLGILGALPPGLVALWAARDVALVSGGLFLRYATRPQGVPFFGMTHSSVPTVEPTTVSKLNTGIQGGLAVAALMQLALIDIAAGQGGLLASDALPFALFYRIELPEGASLFAFTLSATLTAWSWGDYALKQRVGYLKFLSDRDSTLSRQRVADK